MAEAPHANAAPLVGITAIPREVTSLFGPYPAQTLGDRFVRAIEAAGGVPVILPKSEPALATAQVGRLDGLVLSGGSDVDPALYGTEPHPASTWLDPSRDAWEVEVVRAAEARRIPILGVCRGAQLLNVARGGTLVAHLEPELGHEAGIDSVGARHAVAIAPGSLLAGIAGCEALDVTTIHHQAIERAGEGLVVAARAPAGVIEAIEDPAARILGVEWHPELQLAEPAGQPLFDWLVAVARERG